MTPSRFTSVLAVCALSLALPFLSACTSQAAETDASSDATSGTSADTRTIEHARGTTEVPSDPQRVVVLESVEIDTAVALGVPLAGAATDAPGLEFSPYLGIDEVPEVGDLAEPDLEKIAAVQPDLILGTELRHSKLYDQLAQIAPTVFIATQDEPWQDSVRFIGDVLNRQDQADDLLADYTQRCATLSEEFDTSGQTVNVVRQMDETRLRIHNSNSFAGSTLECAGFTIPEQDWASGNGIGLDISPENVADARADVVFYTTTTINSPEPPAAIQGNLSEFPTLAPVDATHWISGVGPMGAQVVPDDIEAFLSSQR